MGKRKADDELERFVWKRNVQYDINLLCEIEQFNPYASRNQKPAWEEVATALKDNPSMMNVTARSCRERAEELLRKYRKDEQLIIRTSGAANDKISNLQTLLTSVSKMEEAKPSKTLKALYSTNDRNKAESVRNEALEVMDNDTSDSDNGRMSSDTSTDEKGNDDFEFGPGKGGQVHNSNPKRELVKFLEKKNEGEIKMRKEEVTLRKEELAIKSKEVEISRLKAEAEIEERKKMMELLMKLATPTQK